MLAAHEIFGFMSPALATEIIDQLHGSDKEAYKSLLASVAEARHVRPVFIQRKPHAEQYKSLVESLTKPRLEAVAITTLQAWLMKQQAAMLTEFLNSLEIKHENGAVEELPKEMADEKLKPAVENLLAKFPHERVGVYLRAFNDLSQANWPNLAKMLEEDARLQLGGG
jgi:hypothetical protein